MLTLALYLKDINTYSPITVEDMNKYRYVVGSFLQGKGILFSLSSGTGIRSITSLKRQSWLFTIGQIVL